MQPAMQPNEVACYTSLVHHSRKIVEYGTGGSTILALSAGVQLLSVESDADWLNKVKDIEIVRQAEQQGRATLIHVNVGPTGDWGFPIDQAHRQAWPNYSAAPWRHWENADLVLIDGRFRV